jgi:hypothetical protein
MKAATPRSGDLAGFRLNWEGNDDYVYKFCTLAERAGGFRAKGDGMKKLELHKETLRDLTEVDLAEVSGGMDNMITTFAQVTNLCPSGATWLMACESYAACS